MSMSEMTLHISMSDAFRELAYDDAELRREVPILLVLRLFRQGTISSGRAAAILDCSRRQFLELLSSEGIPMFDPSEQDLAAEWRTIQEIEAGR